MDNLKSLNKYNILHQFEKLITKEERKNYKKSDQNRNVRPRQLSKDCQPNSYNLNLTVYYF